MMGFDVGGVVLSSPGTTLSVDSAGAQWMAVNASGILTRPQTPYMRGQLTGRGSLYNGGGGSMLVTADVNFGNCWNNATGYWTCPVAGYYMTTLGALGGIQAGYIEVQKNGVQTNFTHWNSNSNSWHYVSLSSIVNCAAGDTLRWLMSGLTPATNGFYGAGGHGMYSIALMA
jgi:C1q domain